MGESGKYKQRVAKYIGEGNGLDIGVNDSGIKRQCIGIDLKWKSDYVNAICDARDLHLFKNSVFDWVNCLTDDTLIHTSEGMKSISSITDIDKIVTHTGCKAGISKVLKRKYVGKIKSITVGLNSISVKATPEHPFLVRTVHGNKWVVAKQLKKGDYLVYPIDRKELVVDKLSVSACINSNSVSNKAKQYSNVCQLREEGKTIDEISSITGIARTTVWQWYTGRKTPYSVLKTESGYVYASNQKVIKDEVKIDYDFCYLFGFFIADGCASLPKLGGVVEFYLHITELDIADNIKRIMYRVFDITPIRASREKYNIIRLRYSSKILSRFFRCVTLKYKYKELRLPEWIMELPIKYQIAIIHGLIDGDGHFSKDGKHIEFASYSKTLAFQVKDILLRLNIPNLIRKRSANISNIRGREVKGGELFEIIISGKEVDRLRDMFGMEPAKIKGYRHSKRKVECIIKDGYLYAPIRNIEDMQYSGDVYDIMVNSEDHSFLANGVSVHNCSHILEDLEDTKAALVEWLRVLKSGGYLIIYCPHKDYYPNIGHPLANKGHQHDFVPTDVTEILLGLGVKIVSCETYGCDTYDYDKRGEIEYSFLIVARKVQ